MLYQHGEMMLETVGVGLRGTVNDVFICRDIGSPLGTLYTLVVIYDRGCAKKMTALMENDRSEHSEHSEKKACLASFTINELLCYLFPYRAERRISSFAAGQLITPYLKESCCINIVIECLSTLLPAPLLYLVLSQNDIHIEKDGSVYFSYCFDLANLDVTSDEKACTARCARLLLELLFSNHRTKLKSYILLQKRGLNGSYTCFPELYRDIRITAVDLKKESLWSRIKNCFERNKDKLFRFLLIVCCIMVLLTLLIIISQVIFGDVPFFRILKNAFEVIGTLPMK